MKRLKQMPESDGSITIFLSLILLIILSLLLTVIEGARVNTAQTYAERALGTSMDSVLAEYYRPLWDEYHIFGLDTGYGDKTCNEEEVITQLQDYMSYTFKPNRDLEGSVIKNGLELYGITADKVSLEDRTMLMDYRGELFINEAVEYMKYKEVGDAVQFMLNKMSLLQSPRKVNALYEEKEKVLDELVEIDEGVLALMELLDGIKTNRKGIEVKKDGTLRTVDFFTKVICFGEPTKEKMGINQESIFLTLRNHYIDPAAELEAVNQNFDQLEDALAKAKIAQKNIEDTEAAIQSVRNSLNELNRIEDKTKEVKAQIKQVNETLTSLEAQMEQYVKDKARYESIALQCITTIEGYYDKLYVLIQETSSTANNAITTLDKILKKTGEADSILKSYEEKLTSEKGEIDDDLYTSLEEELKELKRYTSEGSNGYNFVGMKPILIKDLSILSGASPILDMAKEQLEQMDYGSSRESFATVNRILSTYQTEGLRLDYSTLVLSKDKAPNPIGNMNSEVQTGITELVMDPNLISKLKLSGEALPSEIHSLIGGDTGFLFDVTSLFNDYEVGDKTSGSGEFFGGFSKDTEGLSVASEGVNWLAQQLLFREYIKDSFTSYPKEGEDMKTRKPSRLTYEQEYLLEGSSSDEKNLSSVISKIVLIRTALDFVSLLKDRTKCNEAKAAAAAIVGFTGLPILVTITQTLILLLWSFAESLVDTCALMMGKEVELLKKNLTLNFPDLFLISRELIKKKAEQMVKASESSVTKNISLSYHDYLYIFLLLKNKEDLAYRSMDLIQENLRIRYEDSFSFQNLMFGFKTKAEFTIKPKFITFSFMKKYLSDRPEKFHYKTVAAISY